MNFQEVIKSEAYDFLRTNPHLGKNLLLLIRLNKRVLEEMM